MSRFLLETNSLTTAANSLSQLVSEVANLSSTVNGYDVAEGDADFGGKFSSAKSTIAGNL